MIAVCLQNELCFRTISIINGQFELIHHQKSIPGQFDGIYFERVSGRLFAMSREEDYLQEVITTSRGECWVNEVIFQSSGFFGKSKLRSTKASKGDLPNPLSRLSDIKQGLFGKPFNYRKHNFAFDPEKKLLYVLQSQWKGVNGFEDKIVGQNIRVYNIEGMAFDYWEEIKIEKVLQETNTKGNISKQAAMALREAKQNQIVGISVGSGEAWNLSIMYDNGFQIRLQVLASADRKSFSCLLQQYIGRTVDIEARQASEPVQPQPIYNPDNTYFVPTGPTVTKVYEGLPSIQAVVHKQVRDNRLTLSIENKLSKVPAARKLNLDNLHIYPVEKATTQTLSTVLRVDSDYSSKITSSRESTSRWCSTHTSQKDLLQSCGNITDRQIYSPIPSLEIWVSRALTKRTG